MPALNDLLLLLQEQKHCLYRPGLIWNVIWCGILIIVCCSVVKWGILWAVKNKQLMRWDEMRRTRWLAAGAGGYTKHNQPEHIKAFSLRLSVELYFFLIYTLYLFHYQIHSTFCFWWAAVTWSQSMHKHLFCLLVIFLIRLLLLFYPL